MFPGITLLIAGSNQEERRKKLDEILGQFFPKIPGFNPNLIKITGDIGIDDVRNFKSKLSNKPYDGSIQVGLVEIENITGEAQNALLKLTEEPDSTTQIIITVGSLAKILPTIASRCEKIFTSDYFETGFDEQTLKEAEIIVSENTSAKFKMATTVQAKELTSWLQNQTILWRQIFLIQLGISEYNKSELERFGKIQNTAKTFKFLKNLMRAVNLSKFNVNPRLLLENLFLSIN